MDYQIFIDKYAIKQLKEIDKKEIPKIKEKIRNLSAEPRPFDCIKLKGQEAYRIRSGNYRIIYEIFDKQLIIRVIAIGHRKEIYSKH
jgi:mRNA interferase RelE/StbE